MEVININMIFEKKFFLKNLNSEAISPLKLQMECKIKTVKIFAIQVLKFLKAHKKKVTDFSRTKVELQ